MGICQEYVEYINGVENITNEILYSDVLYSITGDAFGPFCCVVHDTIYVAVVGNPAVLFKAQLKGGDSSTIRFELRSTPADVESIVNNMTFNNLKQLGFTRESALRNKQGFLDAIGYIPVADTKLYLLDRGNKVNILQSGMYCPNFPFTKATKNTGTFIKYIDFAYHNHNLVHTREEEDKAYSKKVDAVETGLRKLLKDNGIEIGDDESISMEHVEQLKAILEPTGAVEWIDTDKSKDDEAIEWIEPDFEDSGNSEVEDDYEDIDFSKFGYGAEDGSVNEANNTSEKKEWWEDAYDFDEDEVTTKVPEKPLINYFSNTGFHKMV